MKTQSLIEKTAKEIREKIPMNDSQEDFIKYKLLAFSTELKN